MLCKRVSTADDVKPIQWWQIPRIGSQEIAPQTGVSQQHFNDLEQQLAELRSSTQAEINRTKQAAFQEGLQKGRDEASVAIRDSAQKLATTLTDLLASKRKLRSDAEREVVKLSVAIARRILNRELATDPDAIQGIVMAALAKLQSRDVWQIRVGSQAQEVTKACVERAGLSNSVKVIVDPALQPGDLIVDTSAGELDACVSTQLQEIERGFAERLGTR